MDDVDILTSAKPPLTPRALTRWSWRLAREVLDEYRNDGVGDLAAAITFWTLLSIPAAVLALVSALGSLERLIGTSATEELEAEIQRFISDTFSDSAALEEAVAELFDGPSRGVVTIATAVAVFTLSRGFAGLIRALDRAYEITDARSWWRVRLVAVGLGVGTIAVAAGSSIMLAILPDLGLGTLVRVLAAPAVVLVVVLWAATVFHIGPNHHTPWRYDLPGALLTAFGWVVASQSFALYVRFAAGGNQVQGTLGTVLLALTLMYALSVVLVMGAELNDVIARRAGVVQQPVAIRDRYASVLDTWSEKLSERTRESTDD